MVNPQKFQEARDSLFLRHARHGFGICLLESGVKLLPDITWGVEIEQHQAEICEALSCAPCSLVTCNRSALAAYPTADPQATLTLTYRRI